jgi:metal-dependent amidase/aminoacylase/carboxypeptidase family protein
MGAEDFAYMLQEKPGCYVWLGNGPGTGGCSLHNPHYDFNDEIFATAAVAPTAFCCWRSHCSLPRRRQRSSARCG